MTQAVLEGVVFALRDSLEVARSLGISLSSTRICGGGAKSPLWKRMVANILNLQVETVRIEEGPAYGAAILAAVGCGEYATVEEAAARLVQPSEVISPDRNWLPLTKIAISFSVSSIPHWLLSLQKWLNKKTSVLPFLRGKDGGSFVLP